MIDDPFFIDECLTLALVAKAHSRGHQAIRMKGMQAVIGALGLVEAERFLAAVSRDKAAVSRDKFDYAEWRKTGLPAMNIEDISTAANKLAEELDKEVAGKI